MGYRHVIIAHVVTDATFLKKNLYIYTGAPII